MIKPLLQYFLRLFYPAFKKILPYEVYAYLAVGAANTALNIFLFVVIYQCILPQNVMHILGLNLASYTISLIIAFLVTVPTGFWLNRHFAFDRQNQGRDQTSTQLGKYFLVVLQGLGTDYLLLISLIMITDSNPTIAKLVSTLVVITINYLLQKHFTFKVKSL
ncbi:MAG: GtrA family protein [Saprospiraceae bacterium]|nr:GtrA family protein [Saprospiraceae bacterium]